MVIRFPAGPARDVRVTVVKFEDARMRIGYEADMEVKIDREVIRKSKDAMRVDGGEG